MMLQKGTRVRVISNKHNNDVDPLLNLIGTIEGRPKLTWPSPIKVTLYAVSFGHVPNYGHFDPWYVYEDDMVNADSKTNWFREED